jgi:hypothetical protein
VNLLDNSETTIDWKDAPSQLYQTDLSKTPIQELKLYLTEQIGIWVTPLGITHSRASTYWTYCTVFGVLDHFWPSNVASYVTEDAVQIGKWVLLQFYTSWLHLITIIYYAVTHWHKHNRPLWVAVQGLIRPTPYTHTHWHSLQSYTPIFHSILSQPS